MLRGSPPVTPPLDTQAGTTPVNLGAAVTDTATLSGTATQPGTDGGNATYPSINATNGAAAGGIITFTLLKADCTTLATGTGTNPQNVNVSGNNTYGPVSFTPNLPGTYHWKAQYIPAATDVNNLGSTHNGSCDDTDETVVVNKSPTEISTSQSVYPNDSATVSVALANQGTGFVAGSVKFRLYDTLANCTAVTPSDTVGVGGLLYNQTVNLPGTQFSSTVGTTNSTVAVQHGHDRVLAGAVHQHEHGPVRQEQHLRREHADHLRERCRPWFSTLGSRSGGKVK